MEALPKKKNVLLIVVDHWPGRFMGFRGKNDIITPTMDALAKAGVSFDNAYSTTPVCIPARRELMTGTCAKVHGVRGYSEHVTMPKGIPTLAQTFSQNGYQTHGVGKLHVYPQRDRIGFDDVLLNEEGRRVNYPLEMREDDYARFMTRAGFSGLEHAHGMSNNNYIARAWHLDESLHQTSWTAREMSEQIIRRDPTKPGFWYCGFTAPHPPLVPPKAMLDLYNDVEVEEPFIGEWAKNFEDLPYCLKYYYNLWEESNWEKYRVAAQKAFYAMCTHIDYSIRSVIGTLREEKLMDNTIIAFTCDHGELLGNHQLFGKNLFYEESTKVPFIIVPAGDDGAFKINTRDNRLVELRDMMPTLLDMCDLEIPKTVDGMSLVNPENKRDYVYGELWEDVRATRMIRTEKYKLIYYAVGNRIQLFDMEHDPNELHDLSNDSAHAQAKKELVELFISRLYGGDLEWLKDGELVGVPDIQFEYKQQYEGCGILRLNDLMLQRGIR